MNEQWISLGIAAAGAALILLLAAFAAAGWFGELPDAVVDHYLPELPEGPLTPDELEDARFATVARGYSPSQVDRLLARAAQAWREDRAFGPLPDAAASAWAAPDADAAPLP